MGSAKPSSANDFNDVFQIASQMSANGTRNVSSAWATGRAGFKKSGKPLKQLVKAQIPQRLRSAR